MIEDVEMKCYFVEYEIMFEYKGNVHFCGVKYDKKRAKAEKRVTFSKELMSIYLDEQSFPTVDELYHYAKLEGEIIAEISDGILMFPEYQELLQKGKIKE